MPRAQCPFLRGVGPDVVVGQNVDQRSALHPVGMVEAHAGGGAGASVMPGDKEFAIAERLHNLDLVLCHRPERIVDVVFAAIIGADAVAVAAQIGGDDVKPFGETAGELVPGDMGQRIAVQQQQRRAVATVPQMDAGAAGGDLRPRKPYEHSALPTVRRPRNLPQRWVHVRLNSPPAAATVALMTALRRRTKVGDWTASFLLPLPDWASSTFSGGWCRACRWYSRRRTAVPNIRPISSRRRGSTPSPCGGRKTASPTKRF